MNAPNPMDRVVKGLFRSHPELLLQLAGVDRGATPVRQGDVTVTLPEFRADHLFLIGEDSDADRWALHAEYQLQPDTRVLRGWFLKNAALNAQLDRPVVLFVLYLERGDRAAFPDEYVVTGGGLRNRFTFETSRLWEFAPQVRSGELPLLAPLLVTWDNEPSLATVREGLRLIENAGLDPEAEAELVALAYTAARRFFTVEALMSLFQEEMQPILKELEPFIRQTDYFQRSVEESRQEGAREMLTTVLRERFGELPGNVTAWIAAATADQCKALLLPALRAASIDELPLD